jgi:integrase/recombinase XerC
MLLEIVPRSYDLTGLSPVDVLVPSALTERPSIDLLELILCGLKPQSAKGYRQDFAHFARFVAAPSVEAALWGLFALDCPRANVLILSYQSFMSGLAPATSNRRVAALLRAVKRGRRAGLTTVALEVDRLKAEALRDTAGPGRPGWERLLASAIAAAAGGVAAPVRDLAVVLLLHDRAMRRGELVGLDYPADVDFERRAVQVLGKGRSAKEWLTVSDRALEALRAWLELRGGDWSGPVFTRLDQASGGRRERLSGESVNSIVKAVARAAKLSRKVCAHGLRHQSITEALDAGWDVRSVKEFSRHKNVETVLIYDDRREDVGGRISRSLGGSGRPRRSRS